jgi:hypothetical protein
MTIACYLGQQRYQLGKGKVHPRTGHKSPEGDIEICAVKLNIKLKLLHVRI